MLFASCLRLRVPTGCSPLGFHFCPFSLRQASWPQHSPCSCVQRETSDSSALCQLPIWAPLSLTSSPSSEQVLPGPTPTTPPAGASSLPISMYWPPDGLESPEGLGGMPGPLPSTPDSPFWGQTAHPSLWGRDAPAQMPPPARPPCEHPASLLDPPSASLLSLTPGPGH